MLRVQHERRRKNYRSDSNLHQTKMCWEDERRRRRAEGGRKKNRDGGKRKRWEDGKKKRRGWGGCRKRNDWGESTRLNWKGEEERRRKLLEEKLINHSFWLGLCTAFRVRQRSKSSFDCFQSVFLEIQQGLWGETVKPKLKREWDETWRDSPAAFRTQRYLPLCWRSRNTLLSDPNTKDQLSAV